MSTYTIARNGTVEHLGDAEMNKIMRDLINFNGGWLTWGSQTPLSVGHRFCDEGQWFTVIGPASMADIQAEQSFIGLDIVNPSPYYYRVTTDQHP